MIDIPDLMRRMSAVGAPIEAIAIAVEAIQASQREIDQRRQVERDRKRRQREKADVTGQSRDSHGTVPSMSGAPPLEQRVSPTPPSETQSPNTPSPPKGGSVPKFSVEFDRFWEAYPRKIGKGDARKAFAKALSRISGPDPPGVLLRALERVRPTWTDPRYIPHPSTWLNGERWEDEPESQILTFRPADGRSHPLRSDKLAAREANLARAFAGAEIAARGRREF